MIRSIQNIYKSIFSHLYFWLGDFFVFVVVHLSLFLNQIPWHHSSRLVFCYFLRSMTLYVTLYDYVFTHVAISFFHFFNSILNLSSIEYTLSLSPHHDADEWMDSSSQNVCVYVNVFITFFFHKLKLPFYCFSCIISSLSYAMGHFLVFSYI